IYFFLAFSLIRLTQLLVLREYGIQSETPSLVLLGSLIIAKVFMIMDHLSFVERYRGRPLVYGVLWKTALYFICTFVVSYLERMIEFLRHKHNFAEANQVLIETFQTPRFWMTEIWLLILIFFFCASRDTIRAVGNQRLRELWFGHRGH